MKKYFDRLHAESMEIFRALSDADLAAKCVTPGGAEITVGKWLRLMESRTLLWRSLFLDMTQLGSGISQPTCADLRVSVENARLSLQVYPYREQ